MQFYFQFMIHIASKIQICLLSQMYSIVFEYINLNTQDSKIWADFPANGDGAKGQNYSNFLTLKTKKFSESLPIEEREKVSTLLLS